MYNSGHGLVSSEQLLRAKYTDNLPGWFPFLFYSTTWVGEVYLRYDAPASVKASNDMTGQVGRIGSLALIGFSVVTFIMSVLLPFVVKSPEGEEPSFTARPPAKLATLVEKAGQLKPSLLTAWTISHGIFAAAMCLAPFVQSLRGATLIIGVCGMYVPPILSHPCSAFRRLTTSVPGQ